MVNGNRQQYDTEARKLSLLTFEQNTLDLDSLQDAPVVRFREAQERFLNELFFPPSETDPGLRASFLVEAHRRILIPLSAFTFSLIPLACLLPGEFNRRGQLARVLIAIAAAFIFQVLDIGINDLAVRSTAAIPLMYVTDLLPFVLGLAILMRGNIKLGFRRSGLAATPAH
jgi:lipopolysaccharide export system permease protein